MNPDRTHDVWVVTSADRERLHLQVGGLERLAPNGTRVLAVLDARRGNLGGTVDAWAAVRDQVGPHERIAILHDGGQATRTAAVTGSTGGSRGALMLGAQRAGQPVDLLGLVALSAGVWANEAHRVDVFWGSQLVLPDRVERAAGWLCKLGRPTVVADVGPDALADLGWLAADNLGRAVDFAPRGRLPDASSWSAWARGRAVSADLGSASLHRGLLDALIELYARVPARKRDLDPDLTDPWVQALAGRPGSGVADAEIAALLQDVRFAELGAVHVRSFSGTWVRLRRPDEIRAALVERVPADPRLRELFGLEHPVVRSTLGGVFVEGPELTWQDVADGVTVGGVELSSAIVRDTTLDAGSRVVDGWVVRSSGRLDVHHAASIDVRRPGRFRHELAIDEHRAHPSALDRLASRATPASDLPRLMGLAATGRLGLGRASTDGPPTSLSAPKAGSRGVLRVRHDLWRDDEGQAELLLDGWARYLGDPGAHGRDAVADGLLELGLAALDPGELPSSAEDLVHAIDAWSPVADPLRVRLGGLLAALAGLPEAAIGELAGLRAAWRLALEHRREALGPAWANLVDRVDRTALARWQASGEVVAVGPAWLPTPPRCVPTASIDDLVHGLRPGSVVGLAGPAAAGKTTLADRLTERLASRAEIVRIHGDTFTWLGDGFRYVQHHDRRDEHIEGPGVYDDRGLTSRILELRGPSRILLVDGVYLGLEPSLRSVLDVLVVLAVDPALALTAKAVRDRAPDSGRVIDLEADFARKLFREHTDALPRLMSGHALVCDGRTWNTSPRQR